METILISYLGQYKSYLFLLCNKLVNILQIPTNEILHDAEYKLCGKYYQLQRADEL